MFLVVECSAPTIPNTVRSPATEVYRFNNTVTFTCNSGYQFSDSSSSFTLTCSLREEFEGERKTCIRTCEFLHLGNRQRQVTQRPVTFEGQTVTYTCTEGFQFNDTSTVKNLTCRADGTFDQNLPSCVPISCGFPAVLPGAGTQAASTDSNIGASVGVGVTGAIVLILLVVIVVVFVKRRRKRMANPNEDIDVSSNGKLSNTMHTTSNTHGDTNLYELEGECPMADRYDQSNNMRQNSNTENQASDVQDLYAVPDKSKKSKKGKKQQNTPASYPDNPYEYVSKPSAQTSSVSRQDCSSTYELAGQFQNGGYTQSIDDDDEVEFVENDIYETGDFDNMGYA
ncbi:uncharacterized protein LOC106154245 [Lingula anatina]|uniref:Uncharacterized protein LOC106154245 n=1 Tax=Lingula anatina TaxID=7574 RepID=A0A1S3HD82_LINAN|nr:uncharacterized protein LOC106154245 [Lingula anatina]|eukprot:XP_013383993.1 uncharacterized protein LOC106154245 [Lingula anatina]